MSTQALLDCMKDFQLDDTTNTSSIQSQYTNTCSQWLELDGCRSSPRRRLAM